jgi:sugar lactone lactonase YvrE
MKTLTRIGLACLFFALLSLSGFAQSGVIKTYAGNGTAGFGGDSGAATAAQLNYPYGVAVDSAGNLYIADTDNGRIRKVWAAGIISTVAGGGTASPGDGGAATAAQLTNPTGVAVDSAGNLYIADSGSNLIRKVTTGGIISTVAGGGTATPGDGGAATAAKLNSPWGVAVDSAGNLYIAEQGSSRIRKVTPAGVISTVAGIGASGFAGDGGSATAAELNHPYGVAVDSASNLYIADTTNRRIRKVTAAGVISTVAGTGPAGFNGDGGAATAAQLNYPYGVTVDSVGNLYIADSLNYRVRKVTAAGVISTVAGNGVSGFSGDGGAATAAQLYVPSAIAFDSTGNLYIADTNNSRVREATGVGSYSVFFPQVAVGGGFTTLFTVTNTGTTAASGSLTLTTGKDGSPLTVSATITDSSGTTQPASVNSTFPLTIPSGGTVFLSAVGATPGSQTATGWGELDSAGGSLSAVATYEYVVGTTLQTMVGVLQSQTLQYVTIPVDNNSSQNKKLAYAIANPSSQTINVKLALVGQDGTVVDDTLIVQLPPWQQTARYLTLDLPSRTDFKGSLVLRGQNGATFVALALVDKQGTLTPIPVISGKAPGVPN